MSDSTTRQNFALWIQDMIDRAGGLRAAGRAAKINHATMLSVSQGNDADLATLERVAAWAGVPLSTVLDKYAGTGPRDQNVEFEMGRLLTQYPRLRSALEMALKHLTDEDLRDVINFIQFKASQHQQH